MKIKVYNSLVKVIFTHKGLIMKAILNKQIDRCVIILGLLQRKRIFY